MVFMVFYKPNPSMLSSLEKLVEVGPLKELAGSVVKPLEVVQLLKVVV